MLCPPLAVPGQSGLQGLPEFGSCLVAPHQILLLKVVTTQHCRSVVSDDHLEAGEQPGQRPLSPPGLGGPVQHLNIVTL